MGSFTGTRAITPAYLQHELLFTWARRERRTQSWAAQTRHLLRTTLGEGRAPPSRPPRQERPAPALFPAAGRGVRRETGAEHSSGRRASQPGPRRQVAEVTKGEFCSSALAREGAETCEMRTPCRRGTGRTDELISLTGNNICFYSGTK